MCIIVNVQQPTALLVLKACIKILDNIKLRLTFKFNNGFGPPPPILNPWRTPWTVV